ncbi:MAG: response regulator transcription factor [Paraburkholderia sp.]|uniref:response regulator transcription factor n=1 Tax=Paraburkholderia sp. TaxID=1926495 RepID=UPI00120FD70D|nr:response regulator transcription factor [Paraburkholderia sp.]TAM00794.1 MAG: response regulator transcription factor [Paraburkholderia sp.]
MGINIALADSHPAVLAGVELVLSKFGHFQTVGTARNSTELETILATTHCDVLVADYLMDVGAHRDGLAFLADIRHRYPALQIVLFTLGDHISIRRAALKIGVHAIVRKSEGAELLIEAIRATCHRIPSDGSDAANAPEIRAPGPPLPLDYLTKHELDVLRLYASGLTVTQIATRLNRTRQTVAAQKRSAMHKCGVVRDVDLLRRIYEYHLLPAIETGSEQPPSS